MHTEIEISSVVAVAAIRLIDEYLTQGGTGHNEELLLQALHALSDADRIVISTTQEGE